MYISPKCIHSDKAILEIVIYMIMENLNTTLWPMQFIKIQNRICCHLVTEGTIDKTADTNTEQMCGGKQTHDMVKQCLSSGFQ